MKLIDLLKEKKKYDNLINSNMIRCENDESFAFLIYYEFVSNNKQIVLVMENLHACLKMSSRLSSMLNDKVFTYCVDEVTKYTTLATSPEMEAQRIFVLNKLINDEPCIIVTHTLAIKRIIPSKTSFIRHSLNVHVNDMYDISNVCSHLVKNGYKNVLKVTQPFEFSSRGGVIDVYSINYDNPIRIEFFDDIIDSIRFFDIESQRTISIKKDVSIIPACEFLFNNNEENEIEDRIKEFAKPQIKNAKNNLELEGIVEEDIRHLSSYDFNETLYKYMEFFSDVSDISDYLENKKVYVCNRNNIKDNEEFLLNEITEELLKNYEEGLSLKGFLLFYDVNQVLSKIDYNEVKISVENQINDLSMSIIEPFDFNLDMFYKQLLSLELLDYSIYIGLESPIHYQSLKQYLNEKNMNFFEIDVDDKLRKGINLSHNDLNIGIDFISEKLYVIGENEIFKKKFKSNVSHFTKYNNAITINSVNELEIGDFLVHDHYGIGIYKGIETMLNNNVHRDYLKIEYKNGDELFLPLEQFKLVRKYVSKEGASPKLNKLGSKEWEKTKARIDERVNEIADRLVMLYSSRAKRDGFMFASDDYLQEAFENDFGYELTIDQKKVLEEIKQDMESPYIMDRIIVGDVGFGKTEIALRAAFKAINSGKQVALLCPTTLLARQHYLTSIERFRNYGVNIKMLSRLVSDKEIKNTLDDLSKGKVNFVIGTHRLLSQDVIFKDLGLLIIDEEHKFGVEHKEKIKEIKQSIDVITLTATPIPRTLQMALTGVRGFSSINTPIENRLPVQTYVIRKDKRAIKEIIERELARNGQVYYLSNRIERLPSIASEIMKLVPNAKIAIAHGQLNIEQMEDIMQRFINDEFNILLCTTIIENGIDIPNVNTIIVDNADCFGLSQLYQIKGRVGRSDKLAYAYLMYAPSKQLSEIATKRLSTIKEFTALGSGYKVAMRDLITRGAGDLLGPEQSGFIETVGIDMYIEMLNNAINNKKAIAEGKVIEKEVIKPNKLLNIDAYIPNEYFSNDYEKIDLYKRIDKVKTLDDLKALKEEIIDQTGKLPSTIDMLFEKKQIDLFENMGVIDKFDEFDSYLRIVLSSDFMKIRGIGVPIFDIACKISNKLSLKFLSDHIECHIQKVDNWLYLASRFIREVSNLKNSYERSKNG